MNKNDIRRMIHHLHKLPKVILSCSISSLIYYNVIPSAYILFKIMIFIINFFFKDRTGAKFSAPRNNVPKQAASNPSPNAAGYIFFKVNYIKQLAGNAAVAGVANSSVVAPPGFYFTIGFLFLNKDGVTIMRKQLLIFLILKNFLRSH